MRLQHFNYFWWDSEVLRIIFRGTFGAFFFFHLKCRLKRESRGMPPTPLDNWLKKATPDDTGLIRPPAAARVSAHKDEVRSIAHGYFQSQFRVPVYKDVGRPTHDSIKREQALTKVTNVFMAQYRIPTDTNELPKLPTKSGEANVHRVYLIHKCNRNTLPWNFLFLPTIGRISQPK